MKALVLSLLVASMALPVTVCLQSVQARSSVVAIKLPKLKQQSSKQQKEYIALQAVAEGRDPFPTVQLPDAFGFNLQRNPGTSADAPWVKQAGAKLVRLPMMWWTVEKVKGTYNFAEFDRIFAAFRQQGLRPVICLGFGNDLYGEAWAVRTPEALAAFSRFASAAASRYKADNVIWEIWNEPNLSSFWKPQSNVQEYMTLVRNVVPAIRTADPTALIIGPALANTTTPFMADCIKTGLLQLVDGIAVHPYQPKTFPEAMANDLNTLRGWIKRYGPTDREVPVLFTEWGYPTAGRSETERASLLIREALLGLMHNIPVNIWFNFREKPVGCPAGSSCYGIITNNYVPGLPYTQFKAFAEQLAGYKFIERIPSPDSSVYCLLLGNGQRFKVVAWTTQTTATPTVALSNGVTIPLSTMPVIRDL
jgi:polysaccharide biosynthesis protein PslG